MRTECANDLTYKIL